MRATRLGSFIQQNIGAILSEWESFAKTRIPAAATMSVLELRDHAQEMLRAIADDIGRQQTEAQRESKAKGLTDATEAHPTYPVRRDPGRGTCRASGKSLRVRGGRGTRCSFRPRPHPPSDDQSVEQRRAAWRRPFTDRLGRRARG
jgi:hypothetical protein